MNVENNLSLRVQPLTPQRWPDLEKLFGPRGACAGCWCLFWKLSRAEFDAAVGDGTHRAQKKIVRSGGVPGLLAYSGDEAVGWIALEPRDRYPRLARSRVLKPVDEQPVWSITCFYTRRDFRRKGVTLALLKAAIAHVRKNRGKIVEGYPIEPKGGKLPSTSAYTGLASVFRSAGFKEVARRSPTRPIFRYEIKG